jgi:beta-lactamase superfamily II metal-dependent hydrolase
MLKLIISSFFLILCFAAFAQNNPLPAWEKGYLDIHFINTGRGDAAFIVMPDGSSLLVDAGDLDRDAESMVAAVPDKSKSPGQWIADYIHQFHPKGKDAVLDYALLTHYDSDHMGSMNLRKRVHEKGDYGLSGMSEVGSIISIGKMIDRGDYYLQNTGESQSQKKERIAEYRKFLTYAKGAQGLRYEKFKVGSIDQIKILNHANDYPDFVVKNLFANGEIAAVRDTTVAFRRFDATDDPSENNLSLGIRISYGPFDFYTGGDIPGIGHTSAPDPESMESYAAPVIGDVDVATLNHHGNRDSQNEFFVRMLQPRVWICQSWTIRHPGEDVLRRIMSPWVYPGERDLFITSLHKINESYIGESRAKDFTSKRGHIVVRVYQGGDNYDVFVLDDRSKDRSVLFKHSYLSK